MAERAPTFAEFLQDQPSHNIDGIWPRDKYAAALGFLQQRAGASQSSSGGGGESQGGGSGDGGGSGSGSGWQMSKHFKRQLKQFRVAEDGRTLLHWEGPPANRWVAVLRAEELEETLRNMHRQYAIISGDTLYTKVRCPLGLRAWHWAASLPSPLLLRRPAPPALRYL